MKRSNFPHRIKRRREEATERAVKRSHLTEADQLRIIFRRRGESEKEMTRLGERIAETVTGVVEKKGNR